jgi:hypothetical protein
VEGCGGAYGAGRTGMRLCSSNCEGIAAWVFCTLAAATSRCMAAPRLPPPRTGVPGRTGSHEPEGIGRRCEREPAATRRADVGWLDTLAARFMVGRADSACDATPRDVNGFCDESGEQTDSHLRATLVGEKVATSRSGEGLSGPTRGWQWGGGASGLLNHGPRGASRHGAHRGAGLYVRPSKPTVHTLPVQTVGRRGHITRSVRVSASSHTVR